MKMIYHVISITIALLLTSCKPASTTEGIVAAASTPPTESTHDGGGNAIATMGQDETTPQRLMFETREAYWEYYSRRREEERAEVAIMIQESSSEARERYRENHRRRREEDAALAPPPDPRQEAWFANYLGPDSYKAPPHVREDYYRYLLETYPGWDREYVLEERRRLPKPHSEAMTKEQYERHWELTDSIGALVWQSWREKYADWDSVRVKEELAKLTDTDNEWPSIEEVHQRYEELFSFMGVFRREYLLERYAGWDIARAEEERERLGTMELPADEIFFRRVELLHYIGILRHEAQDAPTPPEP